MNCLLILRSFFQWDISCFSNECGTPKVTDEYEHIVEFVTEHVPLFLQAQCLINVSGDAVVFVRESELEVVSSQPPTANCQSSGPGGEVTT